MPSVSFPCPWSMQCAFLDLSLVSVSLPEGSSFHSPPPSSYSGGKHCPNGAGQKWRGAGNLFSLFCSCTCVICLEERLTPASSNTREKGKYEHMFSTCQIVAPSNRVFRKEKKPRLSNANKEQYNSFDLLCSSLHQLFQFLEVQGFFENAKSLFQEYKILQVSIFVFIQRNIGQICQIFRTAKEKKKVFK